MRPQDNSDTEFEYAFRADAFCSLVDLVSELAIRVLSALVLTHYYLR